MSSNFPFVNYYTHLRATLRHNVANMGRQSQQLKSNTKRAFDLTSSVPKNRKKNKVDQSTLQGTTVFDAECGCLICKAQAIKRCQHSYMVPKRPHDPLCVRNQRTKGKGSISDQQLAVHLEEKTLQTLFKTPLKPHKKGSAAHLTKEVGVAFSGPKLN